MGVFDDKKFEQLDWMTQITETIDSELNGLLARLPDKMVININDLTNTISSSYGSLHTDSVVRALLNKTPGGSELSWEEMKQIIECFKFETEGELELDFTKPNPLKGELFLVKKVSTLDDKDLQEMMGSKGLDELAQYFFDKDPPLDRMNEILDILGGSEAFMRNRSVKKKMYAIRHRMKNIFVTNEWRIRDMTLANKVCGWIRGYIHTGNLADLTNLCKIKVMTHSNMPIYSIEEEK
jgi:hypothetical protein